MKVAYFKGDGICFEAEDLDFADKEVIIGDEISVKEYEGVVDFYRIADFFC